MLLLQNPYRLVIIHSNCKQQLSLTRLAPQMKLSFRSYVITGLAYCPTRDDQYPREVSGNYECIGYVSSGALVT